MNLLLFTLACGTVSTRYSFDADDTDEPDGGIDSDASADSDADTDGEIDGGSDLDTDVDADSDSDADTDSDTESSSETETETDDLPPCDGWADPDLGGCWYLSARGSGDTCNETCAEHGGFDAVTSAHIGIAIGHHFYPDPDYNEAADSPAGMEIVIHCGGGGTQFIYRADGSVPDGDYSYALGCSELVCSCFE